MGITIISTGIYVPETIETVDVQYASPSNENNDLASWMFSGGRVHRVSQPYETSTYMGIKAASSALVRGGIDPKTIDAVICYTCIADSEIPKDVYAIMQGIGCSDAMAWTIDTACASFLSHLHCAHMLSLAGKKRLLIIDSVNWVNRAFDTAQKRNVEVLVGDGAGAVILEYVPGRGSIIDIIEKTSTENFDFIRMNTAQVTGDREHLVLTKNQGVTRKAFAILPETAHALLQKNGLAPTDVTWVITHQPGHNALLKWHEMLGVPMEKNLNTFNLYGNMSAANIPVTLDHYLYVDPRIKRGDVILAFTAGAGIHCVATLIEY